MPEWQPIGGVGVCVGTNGVTGVWNGKCVVVIHNSHSTPGWGISKEDFEADYCKPRHRLIESCDGSVCVVSTEEQDGKPVRMAAVRRGLHVEWVCSWKCGSESYETLQSAIDRAIRYVEKGE